MIAPTADAYELWTRARTAVTSAAYPSRIDYTIAISGLDGAAPVADHYRGSCDPADGSVRTFPISDEELAKPAPVPHGFNTNVFIGLCSGYGPCGTGISLPLGHSAPYDDLLGLPLLAPTYMFGMKYTAIKMSEEPGGKNSLPVIATVRSQSPEYRVTLLDTPAIDGVPTYHLKLDPLRQPKTNRLREVWIGITDYLPRRAILAGNFTLAPFVDVAWTVDFTTIDGAPYVDRETTPNTLYLTHRRVVRNAAIAFQNIREQTTIYDQPLVEPNATDTSLVEP